MEHIRKVKRSQLWNDIFAIVKQIPRKDVDGDALDAASAATMIEDLLKPNDGIVRECHHDGSISRPLIKKKGEWVCGYCNKE